MADKQSWKQQLSSAFAGQFGCLVFLVCLPFALARSRRKAGFRKVKGQWAWVGYNAGVGKWGSFLNVSSDSFVVLNDARHAKDQKRVFFKWHEIVGADPDSFEILPYGVGVSGCLYSRDSNHVYLEAHQIPEADPESFVVIDAPYARDRVRVYCGTVPMEGADPETFQVMRMSGSWSSTPNKEHFIRLNGPAFNDLEISKSRPAVTSPGSWAKDAQYHYRGAARVIGADYDTFQATNDTCGVDKDYEYVGPLRKEEFEG